MGEPAIQFRTAYSMFIVKGGLINMYACIYLITILNCLSGFQIRDAITKMVCVFQIWP